MKKTTLVTFFTNDAYKHEAQKLIATATRHGAMKLATPDKIEPGMLVVSKMPDSGHWGLNNQKKAGYILQMMNTVDGPIMWVDADCLIHENVEWALTRLCPGLNECDLAFPTLIDQATKQERLFASTLWFNNTDRTRALLVEWIGHLPSEAMMRSEKEYGLRLSEQSMLEDLLTVHYDRGSDLVARVLPHEFACVFDIHPFSHPGIVPVIEAFQYSRVAKAEAKNA